MFVYFVPLGGTYAKKNAWEMAFVSNAWETAFDFLKKKMKPIPDGIRRKTTKLRNKAPQSVGISLKSDRRLLS